jgi:hypothetical protein
MGYDLAIITKTKIPSEGGVLTDVHFLVDRGFCTMILNAKNHPEPVLAELEKALNIDLSFLEKIEFNDEDESELRELGFDENYINSARNKSSTGYLRIDEFLNKLNSILIAMESNPMYESKMSYERIWWHSYFDMDFRIDLNEIKEFLTNLLSLGETEFTFRMY